MGVLTKREKATLQRIDNVQRATRVLNSLIKMGFKSLPSIVAITQHYYPDATRAEMLSFWHFRNVSGVLVDRMERLIDQLKSE